MNSTKTLLVLRHAKSDWTTNVDDFNRPLNQRGQKNARKMGAWLQQQNLVPDCIISSPAERARQTILIVCEQLKIAEKDILWDERIYDAELDDILQVVSEYLPQGKSLLLVGHNPGLDYLVEYLSAIMPVRSKSGKLMTTAAIAQINLEDGAGIRKGSGRVVQLVRPNEL